MFIQTKYYAMKKQDHIISLILLLMVDYLAVGMLQELIDIVANMVFNIIVMDNN